MSKGNHGYSNGYTYTGSGTNSQVCAFHYSDLSFFSCIYTRIKGNHWCSRDAGNGTSGYHYSNS